MSKQDATDAVAAALSGLAIALQVLVVVAALIGLVALFSPGARRLLAGARDALLGGELWAAWVVALVSVLGSLFFSEISDFIPCRLCWYQRIAMYPLVIILLVGALRRDVRAAVQYAFAFPVIGAGIAIYHIYIEHHPEAETAGCKIGAPCSTKWFEKFGYVTIPVLALSAFAAIIVLLAMAWSRRDRPGPDGPPPGAAPETAA